MTIRLNKVARDLNVGIQTAVDFLQKKGFSIEASPMTKISEEQHALLIKEFSKDQNLKKESERISFERHNNKEKSKESVSIEGYEPVKKENKLDEIVEIKTVISDEIKPRIKQVGKIDLNALSNKHAKPNKPNNDTQTKTTSETPTSVIDEPVAPKQKTMPEETAEIEKTQSPAEPESNNTTQTTDTDMTKISVSLETASQQESENLEMTTNELVKEEEKEEEVFTLNRPKLTNTINVVGKIDLTALNQQTRPKKKSKEERRKEREAKDAKRNEQKKNIAQSKSNITGNSENEPETERRKRKRINKEKVDIERAVSAANQNRSNNRPSRDNAPNKNKPKLKKPVKAEINEEDVQKQIKETLARLTTKTPKKGMKHRKDKREAFQNRMQEIEEQEMAESKILKLTEFVTANDLANLMNIPVNQVIATCMSIGIMVSINQRLDAETINIVAEEFGYTTEYVSAEVVEAISSEEEQDAEEDLQPRAPIVTVMGHVDHGKTSLLDYIRNANVIAGEAGGITQHIGAYNVKLEDGRRITFLDTPGHEAFTAMRARGAKVTDIAIIIVAADDNVMPQTVEAINHASAAGVPMVFAINKIDKPNANPDKIKEELANMNYLVEDWGGKYQSQEISAKKGTGVHELLEKVLLEAELLDLKANPDKRATGSIIESTLDKGRGYVATILVENGTLKTGDIVLAGTQYGRIKAMFNERNQRIKAAGPAEPVLILGLNGAPQAGDKFNVLETDQEAREIANKREQLQRELGLRTQKILTLDDIGRRIAIGNFQELNVIVKGDVDGSIEALSDSLIKLSTEEIQVNVIHKAVGQISESDVTLAAASNAIIIGFQVRPSISARKLAEKEGVDIRLYSIIYDAIEEVKSAMEGMLSPEIKEEITATVEVRETFHISKVGTVAGCIVKEGKIKRNSKVRLIRDGIVIYSGELGSLKRFKDDVKEVASGYECGLNITNYNDIKIGDIIEAYEEVEVKKTL